MMDVSRETAAKLDAYTGLIRKWNPTINLVAPSTLNELQDRHIGDCLQVVDVAAAAKGTWLDLGSGSGLPGLVVAICRPDLAVTLLESDRRKATFIRTAMRELDLHNCKIVAQRIESAEPLNVSNVSARALASLSPLLSYVHRHMSPRGRAWLMKGRNWQAEVEEAKTQWKFQLISHPSRTDSDAAILEISGIRHD